MLLKLQIIAIITLVLATTTKAQISGAYVGTKSAHPFSIISNAATRLTITPSGDVGIGTTNPNGFKLAVNGFIKATKLKVTQTGWPDYVFEPSYKLPPLAEVEGFIKKHKHLPEVSSAEQVNKEGLDVGDMQSILLKKIEELTLYIIEINKKQETLEKSNAQLKAELQFVQSELKNLRK